MAEYVIRHLPESDRPRFEVGQPSGGGCKSQRFPGPNRFPVAGRPQSHLVRELRWHLEQQLGILTQRKDEVEASEHWYRRALQTNKKYGNEHAAAASCANLGILFVIQGHFTEAGPWLVEAIGRYIRSGDPNKAGRTRNTFCLPPPGYRGREGRDEEEDMGEEEWPCEEGLSWNVLTPADG